MELVADLETRFRDGWALSCSMASLDVIVPLLPTGEWHLCPWVKQNNPPADTYGLHTCWEALIVVRGRQAKPGRRDWLLAQPARGGGHTLMGRKPIAFVAFLFQALGLVNEAGVRVNREDQLHDLFPGTGIVGNAWADLARDPTADASFVDRQGVAA